MINLSGTVARPSTIFGSCVLTAIMLVAGNSTLGQESSRLSEITVHAQREVSVGRKPHDGLPSNHMTKELVTVTAGVNFADLNLAAPDGAAALRARIDDVARGVCRQLDLLYSVGASDVKDTRGNEQTDATCIRDAVASTTKRVNEAIAAAAHK